jgi:4a-hydroxytetrahydrobiopterin dehydratase
MGVRDPLDADDVEARLDERDGWVREGTGIAKAFAVSHDAIARIFPGVWRAADELEHHPDIDIRWETMRFFLTTHTAGDVVTELDFLLADRIDQIAAEQGAYTQ